MKTLIPRVFRLFGGVMCTAGLLVSGSDLMAQNSQPVIESIIPQQTNIVVHVAVPKGVKRVTLESRTRLDAGAWVPAAVRQLDGSTPKISFTLPRTQRYEMLRIRADFQQPLPGSFYSRTNTFSGPPTNNIPYGVVDMVNGSGPETRDSATRSVTESDIWNVSGDRLYFFNQYRGLQVIDISNPDTASLLGTLPLPAAGEQMYLADSNHVVLLARNGCGYFNDGSQVVIVGVTNGLPQGVTNLTVAGYLQESRMVGTALYVASQTYRPVDESTNDVWEWGTLVSSFDLSTPNRPITRNTLWYGGYGNVVTATDTFLFVVTQEPNNWWQSIVHSIDITSPDGAMLEYANIRTSGSVKDKFKINYSESVLTTISEDWRNVGGIITELETFRLPDPKSEPPGKVERLGMLELGKGEQLHATRFDGSRVYVVTFLRIDPLWVVDLSDPAQPHIAGELAVPGWSTYIYPMGSRLLAVGVESNRVAVSLFDVSNPAKPGLLSRLLLGQNYSWTEANYDEKAFTVLPDANLVLVPYSGDTTNGWTSQVQLIDLLSDSLVARGIIEHPLQPRRATYSHNRILSLSGWDLLSVEATDRDKPLVLGETELAWPVDRLFVAGDYVVELGSASSWWGAPSPAAARVAPADDPSLLLNRLELGALPIVGAALDRGLIYIAQSSYSSFYTGDPEDGTDPTNAPNFFLTVVDTKNLPALEIVGKASTRVEIPGWSGGWEALWPKPGVLVFVGGGMGGWWWGPWLDSRGGGGLVGDLWFRPGSWGMGGGQLLAFDVSSSSAPALVSELNLTTNGWWRFSPAIGVGSLVYLSHSSSEPADDPAGMWIERTCLDVVDYSDPASPTVRKPVLIPGKLEGVSHNGELLYTSGIHWITNQTDWRVWLDASAYDGVSAHPVCTLPLPDSWPHPLLVLGQSILIGHPSYDANPTNTLAHKVETWDVDEKGAFVLTSAVNLAQPANTMVQRNGLLAVQDSAGGLELFNATDPAKLEPLGGMSVPGCLWFDLTASQGGLTGGLWMPLGAYGVIHAPLKGP
jgi:hypothetical protein